VQHDYGLAQALQLCTAFRALLQVRVYGGSLGRRNLLIQVSRKLLDLDVAPDRPSED